MTAIETGARVRLSRALTDDERTWAMPPQESHGEFTVDDYAPALENPTEDEIPVAFYEGSGDNGATVVVPADAVVVVKTAAQMAARKPPTPERAARRATGRTPRFLRRLRHVGGRTRRGRRGRGGRPHQRRPGVRVPRHVRAGVEGRLVTARPRCWCGRPVPETSPCGRCCAEHDCTKTGVR